MKPSQLTNEQIVLDTIINNIPAMVFYKNLQGEYIAANQMFCKQLKTTPQDIIGKTDFDFYEVERAEHYRQSDIEVIQSNGSIEGFEEEIRIDEENRIFATRKVLIRDQGGDPSGIIGLVYDVTQSRKTEQDLLESRTRYKYTYDMFRLMADNIPDLLWAKDLRKRYLFVNKAVCEKLLITEDTEEPIGKTELFFVERERQSHPEETERHTFGGTCGDSDEVTISTKAPGQFEEFGNIKGQYLYLDVNKAPILDDDGNIIGIVGSGRDITKQKLIEKELHNLNQRNRAILEALPDLMFLFDTEGNFLECYASNSEDLLVPPDEIIGKNISDFFGKELSQRTLGMIGRCLATRTIQTMEYEVENQGEKFFFEARGVMVDEQKVLCISRNITDVKNLQFDLIEARDKAEESSRIKTILLNNMSHELRTPLNGILGFSEILCNEINSAEHVEMSKHINNSGKRLMKTLDSIMQLSQLESGSKALQTQEVKIENALRSIVETFEFQARNKGLYFEVRNNVTLPGHLDNFFFIQSISNLIDNAIKFTREGGISIDISDRVRGGERWLSIDIEDTGIGISHDHKKLIFEEFRQASEGQNRSFEGTGLGLTIAKKMIDLLGGEISLESRIGKGSLFKIQLPFPEKHSDAEPMLRTSQRPTSTSKPLPSSRSEKPYILLVEDNEINMQLTEAYVKNSYNLEWAHDGPTGVEMAKNRRYDAILLDINLGPGMDGLQAIQLLRKIEGYESVPIIALTGYTLFGDKDRVLRGGCNEYIAKPFSRAEILRILAQNVIH